MYLTKGDILDYIEKEKLIIRPLVDEGQIGAISIDFRLGYDFLVSIQNRNATIEANLNSGEHHAMASFFQHTRRRPGENFLLHPGQAVLGATLEYVKLPRNLCLELRMRSSYNRLGLSLSSIVQPGYCGVISLELVNNGRNSINLTVGARVCQATVIQMKTNTSYFSTNRKYSCSVRPEISNVLKDKDLEILHAYNQDVNG